MQYRDRSEQSFLEFWNLQCDADCLPHLVSFRLGDLRILQSPCPCYMLSNEAVPCKFFDRLGAGCVAELGTATFLGGGAAPGEVPGIAMFMLLPHASLLLRNAMHPPVAVYPLVGCGVRKAGIECVQHLLPVGPAPHVPPLVEHEDSLDGDATITAAAFESLTGDLRLWSRYIPTLDRPKLGEHLAFLEAALKSFKAPNRELGNRSWQYVMPRVLQGLLLGTKVPEEHMHRVLSHALRFTMPAAWAQFFVEHCLKGKEKVLPSVSTLRRYKLTLHVAWTRLRCHSTMLTLGFGEVL